MVTNRIPTKLKQQQIVEKYLKNVIKTILLENNDPKYPSNQVKLKKTK